MSLYVDRPIEDKSGMDFRHIKSETDSSQAITVHMARNGGYASENVQNETKSGRTKEICTDRFIYICREATVNVPWIGVFVVFFLLSL